MFKRNIIRLSQQHLFHILPGMSPWPFLTALSLLGVIINVLSWIYQFSYYNNFFAYSFAIAIVSLILSVCGWWNDVIAEGTFEGRHTSNVQRGLRIGMVLFILSEVMFFFAFFWAYFHRSLAPRVEIGCTWPPQGIVTFDPWRIPLLNTYILLLSGATITYCHHSIVRGDYENSIKGFGYTILLAVLFTILQGYEYFNAPFSINDGIYGRTFYMATGFHGLHVIIGTCFIAVCAIRLVLGHFTKQHHFGFEAAAWYWHFVDVVWLFLYISIYWWGSA